MLAIQACSERGVPMEKEERLVSDPIQVRESAKDKGREREDGQTGTMSLAAATRGVTRAGELGGR